MPPVLHVEAVDDPEYLNLSLRSDTKTHGPTESHDLFLASNQDTYYIYKRFIPD